jgi:hypothetical protein
MVQWFLLCFPLSMSLSLFLKYLPNSIYWLYTFQFSHVFNWSTRKWWHLRCFQVNTSWREVRCILMYNSHKTFKSTTWFTSQNSTVDIGKASVTFILFAWRKHKLTLRWKKELVSTRTRTWTQVVLGLFKTEQKYKQLRKLIMTKQ